jgi:SSS family solute:Na+ symporter
MEGLALQPIDIAIILLYILATIGIGFYISKKASSSIENYFLGGNEIRWQFLGLSNASGMFDISGTMWMVALLFIYGLKSVWIPWLWPVFNQIFMMIFLSIWLRRSGMMTGAEWIRFRFGDGFGSQLSHIVVVIFAVIVVIANVAYGFLGIGKFAAAFLPFQLSPDAYWNEMYWAIIFTAITTAYVIKGGMYSVVFTEVLQYVIMTIASIAVGIIAMQQISPDMLAAVVPVGWGEIGFSWNLDLNWDNLMPAVKERISEDGYEIFGLFFTLVLLKGILQSMAGPAPTYDMQRVLSTRTPRDAAKMSGFVNVVLLFPRYMLITGLTILALVFFSDEMNQMGSDVDFEQILPFTLANFVPVGLLGLLVAGLLAAFMSTFAAAVNAAPAYLVNDIYKRYLNDSASEKTYVNRSYLCSFLVVLVGSIFGLFLDNLNSIIGWIVSGLYGGYTAANLLKWYWWRFNSYGYFWGMVAGIVAALGLPWLLDVLMENPLNALEAFPINLGLSLLGCLLGSLLTKPDPLPVLKQFYLRTRPWGFWRPVAAACRADNAEVTPNGAAGRDLLNVAVGIVWQTAITAAPIFMVIKSWTNFFIALAVVAVCTVFLKVNWYDRMEDWPSGVRPNLLDKE